MAEKEEENSINQTNPTEGFFKRVIKSIKDFDKYEDFALEKVADGMKYIVKLIALFCAIICIAYTYKTVNTITTLYTGLKEKTPAFSYKDGMLTTESEKPTIIEEYGDMIGSIIIDTEIETKQAEETYQEQINKYGAAIIVTKDSMLIRNPALTETMQLKHEELVAKYFGDEFNKQKIIEEVDKANAISFALSIYISLFMANFISYFIAVMVDVLILALLAYIAGRVVGIKLKTAPSFNVGAHAITLSVVLNMVYMVINALTGFQIKYFQIMYNAVAYIYVVVAILMIKTDFLNRQMELMKLAQEQMRIKEEMKKQEEEEQKKKEEEKNNPADTDNEENKEKKDKKDKKENNSNKKEKKEKPTEPDEPLGNATATSKGE